MVEIIFNFLLYC